MADNPPTAQVDTRWAAIRDELSGLSDLLRATNTPPLLLRERASVFDAAVSAAAGEIGTGHAARAQAAGRLIAAGLNMSGVGKLVDSPDEFRTAVTVIAAETVLRVVQGAPQAVDVEGWFAARTAQLAALSSLPVDLDPASGLDAGSIDGVLQAMAVPPHGGVPQVPAAAAAAAAATLHCVDRFVLPGAMRRSVNFGPQPISADYVARMRAQLITDDPNNPAVVTYPGLLLALEEFAEVVPHRRILTITPNSPEGRVLERIGQQSLALDDLAQRVRIQGVAAMLGADPSLARDRALIRGAVTPQGYAGLVSRWRMEVWKHIQHGPHSSDNNNQWMSAAHHRVRVVKWVGEVLATAVGVGTVGSGEAAVNTTADLSELTDSMHHIIDRQATVTFTLERLDQVDRHIVAAATAITGSTVVDNTARITASGPPDADLADGADAVATGVDVAGGRTGAIAPEIGETDTDTAVTPGAVDRAL